MNVRERLFLISGGNFIQRQNTLEAVKKRLLKELPASLHSFNFYAKELSLEDLSEKIFTAPFGQTRIIVFRDFHQLASPVRKFIFKNLKKILAANYLIFDSDKDYYQLQRDKKISSDNLFTFILKQAVAYRLRSFKESVSFRDLMYSLGRNDLAQSLYIVESLFRSGSKEDILGPQIIGMLVKKCSGLPSKRKEDCLEHLWTADRAIKEKGSDSRLIIERLLVKIFTPFLVAF